jgi:hypothetical protein
MLAKAVVDDDACSCARMRAFCFLFCGCFTKSSVEQSQFENGKRSPAVALAKALEGFVVIFGEPHLAVLTKDEALGTAAAPGARPDVALHVRSSAR